MLRPVKVKECFQYLPSAIKAVTKAAAAEEAAERKPASRQAHKKAGMRDAVSTAASND